MKPHLFIKNHFTASKNSIKMTSYLLLFNQVV